MVGNWGFVNLNYGHKSKYINANRSVWKSIFMLIHCSVFELILLKTNWLCRFNRILLQKIAFLFYKRMYISIFLLMFV